MYQIVRPMHMIFTRVEAAFSPTNESRFQVYYHSPGIADKDVELIRDRVQVFRPNLASLVRKQFFLLPDRQVVVTSTHNFMGHPQINDKYERDILLAHCLVFSTADFSKTLNNPFKIFDHFDFLSNAEAMVKQFDQRAGREPETWIEFDPYAPICSTEDWFPDLVKLVGLALKERKGEDNPALVLKGTQDQILARLRAVFELMPVKNRLSCSFDTFAEGENLKAGKFLFVCGPDFRDSSNIVDAQTGKVGAKIELINQDDLYLSWLQNSLKTNTRHDMSLVPVFKELCAAFKEQRTPEETVLASPASQEFYKFFKQVIANKLLAVFSHGTSAEIGQLLSNAYLRTVDIGQVLKTAAVGKLSAPQVAECARQYILMTAPKFNGITNKDWRNLSQLGRQAGDDTLVLWAAIQTKNKNLRLKTLKKISRPAYVNALELLGNPILPLDILMPAYMPELIKKLVEVQNQITGNAFSDMLDWCFKGKSEDLLGGTTSLVSRLDNMQLYRV